MSYPGTLDWDQYWDTANEADTADASPSEGYILDPLREFLQRTVTPSSYADVGCGAGVVAFAIAEQYSEASVAGYDAVESILERNRERMRKQQLSNLRFEQATLPEFTPDYQFDVVSCFYTLCYVKDSERALQNLHSAVAPDGYLVVTYHNQFAQSIFRRMAESPKEYLDESSPWKPDRFADRFELVISGENILSYDRIHQILGAWPQSLWSETTEAERYAAWRQNPLIYVPK